MGLVSDADRAKMAADLLDVISDNAIDVAIRRAGATLPVQTVRIARTGSGSTVDTGNAQQATAGVIVAGAVDLDIQPGDRLTDGAGNLIEIVYIRPNRTIATVAEARSVQ